MTSSEKTNWYVPIIIFIALTTIFFGLYYSSDLVSYRESQLRKEFDYAGRPTQPITRTDQVFLKRDEKKIVGKYGLTFRGLENKLIVLDLYLMEMDPHQPYRRKISKKEAKESITFGTERYRLSSVNRSSLVLKKITVKTP